MQAIARLFSTLLSPLLMPTYGIFLVLWVSILCYLPTGTRMVVLLVVFGITCILPMTVIAVLHNLKVIEDKRLVNRKERLLPYIAAFLCYVGCGLYLTHIHMQQWAVVFAWGGAAACVVATIVNFWWKISAHMAGIGGVLAFLVRLRMDGLAAFNIYWLICAIIILAGMLGTSRIYMNRHTLWQVVAGFANGYICVYTLSKLLA